MYGYNDYYVDIAANRCVFSMADKITPEVEEEIYETPYIDEYTLECIMKDVLREHLEHYVYLCNHVEYINRAPVLPPYPSWYLETEGSEFIWEEDDDP